MYWGVLINVPKCTEMYQNVLVNVPKCTEMYRNVPIKRMRCLLPLIVTWKLFKVKRKRATGHAWQVEGEFHTEHCQPWNRVRQGQIAMPTFASPLGPATTTMLNACAYTHTQPSLSRHTTQGSPKQAAHWRSFDKWIFTYVEDYNISRQQTQWWRLWKPSTLNLLPVLMRAKAATTCQLPRCRCVLRHSQLSSQSCNKMHKDCVEQWPHDAEPLTLTRTQHTQEPERKSQKWW